MPSKSRSDESKTELVTPMRGAASLNCELPPAAWQGFISHVSSHDSAIYWLVVDGDWRILAASHAFQSRVLGDPVAGEIRFLDRLTEGTALDLQDRHRWGMLAGTTIELIHPRGETASGASYTFLEIENGYLLVGQDESRQIELVSQMSGLVQNLESEMERERALGESLQSQLSIDHLTGVASRRRVEDLIRAAWDRWTRAEICFGVISIDVDRFKSVNDRFGHDVGDEVLRRVAAAIGATVRESDTVGRLGGEEFVVVTPLAVEEPLERMAERIRARVGETKMPGKVGRVTISLGVATAAGGARSVFELLKQADTALYEAKGAGRDRVVLASAVVAKVAADDS